MATLIFSSVGSMIGGPLGGMLGAMGGRAIDSMIFGTDLQGPRLHDLSVTASTYGAPIPRHFGAMRVAGSIIWATNLVEHAQNSGGGKGSPTITTYTYTSSFAVALASRPLTRVGRIWADGNLLRGASGDLKVGGTMRFYPGDFQQAPDALIAAAEGGDACPAFRGLSYVVFEDLQLSTFGNRIPALTFEVFADDSALSVDAIFAGLQGLDDTLQDIDAAVPLDGIEGFTCDTAFRETLAQFQPMFPMTCNAGGTGLTISPERLQSVPIVLGEAAISDARDSFGAKSGYARKRSAPLRSPPRELRYYDTTRDYQPGLQRALGNPCSGQPASIELPASMTAGNAFRLINQTAKNANWSRDTLGWRTSEIDPDLGPGALVTVPDNPGTWRVMEWEWHAAGVDLTLERSAPINAVPAISADAGKALRATDQAISQTALQAYELPWNGTGSASSVNVFVASSSPGTNWSGASLFADCGTGGLIPIGTTGRKRSTIGTTTTTLPAASFHIFDRNSTLDVQLIADDIALTNASPEQLAMGKNMALVGNEIIQYCAATSLGAGQWQLSGLLRGRGGTERAVSSHGPGEGFVLLDEAPIRIDPAQAGLSTISGIVALGLADENAVEAEIACAGASRKPLSPVHPKLALCSDGSVQMSWTRRARGNWSWADGVDIPLIEEQEAYDVTYGTPDTPTAIWHVSQPSLALPSDAVAALTAAVAGGAFHVRQVGTFDTSAYTTIGTLA